MMVGIKGDDGFNDFEKVSLTKKTMAKDEFSMKYKEIQETQT